MLRSTELCYRVLGLTPFASGDDIRAAFRRLAKAYHPDLNPGRATRERFIEVVSAYGTLRDELGLRPDATCYRRCPRCGRFAELLDGLDGRAGCVDCLLGMFRRNRLLPGPTLVTVGHGSVIGLYGMSILLGCAGCPLLAGSCALAGMVVLAITCIVVSDT